MGMSRNINTYSDVKDTLDQALNVLVQGRVEYVNFRLPARGPAIHWIQRAYAFRKLAQAQAAEMLPVPGMTPTTPYDSVVLKSQGDGIVRISLRKRIGTLETPDGKPVEPTHDDLEDLTDDFTDAFDSED